MKFFYLSFSAFIIALCFALTSNAQIIPQKFSYQGYLEENGLPFDGQATFTFTIGSWSETQTLNVDAGLYSATLGANNAIPIALFAQNPVPALQVSVNGVALSPNTGFLSVPYAFMAQYVADTSVTTTQIRNFTILPEDMNPGGNATTLVTDTTGTVRWAPVSTVGDNLGDHTIRQVLESDLSAGDIIQIGDDVVLQDINVPGVLGLRGPIGGNNVGIRLGGILAITNPVLFGTNNAMLFAFGNSEKMRLNTTGQLGLNTNAPDASALMHIESTTQGLLIPRMTSAERTAIANPANGLLVFDTDVNSLFFYDAIATAWNTFSTTNLPDGQIWVGNTGAATPVTANGDLTIDNTGLTTIQPDAVESAEILDGTITTLDIGNDQIQTLNILDDNVTLAKIANGVGDEVLTTDPTGNPQWEARANFASSTLTSGNILVGDATNIATDVPMTGDVAIDNTGLTTIQPDAVESAEILDGTITTLDIGNDQIQTLNILDDNVTLAKIANGVGDEVLTTDPTGNPQWEARANFASSTLTSGNILVGDLTNIATDVPMTGDVAIDNAGLTTIQPDAVESAEILDGTITTLDIGNDQIQTLNILDDNVTLAKIANGVGDEVLTTDPTGNPQWEARANFASSTLTSGNILVGDLTNIATDVPMTGDVAIDNAGLTTIQPDAVESAEILDGTITTLDLATDIADQVLTTDPTGIPTWETRANFDNTTLTAALTTGAIPRWDGAAFQNSLFSMTAGFLTAHNGTIQINNGFLQISDASAAHYTTFQPSTQTANIIYRLPPTGGLADEVMVNDGAGNLSWQPAPIAPAIEDFDADTKIQVEESPDEDMIRFDIGGAEYMRMEKNGAGQPRMRLSTKNVIIGENAGNNLPSTVERAILIGTEAGRDLIAGDNIMIGRNAGGQITNGTFNVMIGGAAGSGMTGGIFNVMIGRFCGAYRTTGDRNVFIGSSTAENFNGGGNVVLGDRAAGAGVSRTGSNNVILGNRTMENVNGNNNVAIGPSAGLANGGSGNVFLGANAGRNETGSNLLYIDNSNTGTPLIWGDFAADQVRINGELTITGDAFINGVTPVVSDRRFKKNIRPLESALNKTLKLRGVRYDWRRKEFPDMNFSEEQQLGFIAQEVEKEFPELVHERADGYKAVDYSRLTPILVEAIKELKAEIDALCKENQALAQEQEKLKGQVQGLKAKLENQDALNGRMQELEAKLESQQQKLSELVDKLLQFH